MAMSALVLAGLPTTRIFTSFLALLLERRALRLEDPTVGAKQIAALHPGLARHGADQQGDVGIAEGDVGIVGAHHVGSSGKAQSSSSIFTPPSAPRAGVISSSWRITGVSGPSIDPEAIRNSRL